MSQAVEDVYVLEQLKLFRQVCLKIRSSLIAGREEVVSPTAVCRTFMDAFEAEKVGESGSTDSGIFPGSEAPSAESAGGASRSSSRNGSECPFIEHADGWSVEYYEKDCERCGDSLCMCTRSPPNLGLRPLAEAAYREHFYQREHSNYIADEPDIGPLILSIKQEGDSNVRILLRSSDHYLHGVLSLSSANKTVCLDETVRAIAKEVGLVTQFKIAQYPDIEKEFLRIDETFVKNHHKIGVIRVREGQRTEEDIFSNIHEPGAYDSFLNLLGTRTKLKGFKGFLGGLDSDRDLTGETTVFTEHLGLEVMFHVATLLPFTPNDNQQINKKRHIGNDIVSIVFLDTSRTTFNPSWIRSNFIHCYIVVQLVVGAHGQPLYKVGVTKRSTVPTFSPELKHFGVFAHSTMLQQFLLSKVVNGERASYHAPKFLKLTNRSRGQLLQEFSDNMLEYTMAGKQRRTTRRINKRSNWLPIGASRPPSPILDSVREKYVNSEKLAEDFSLSFRGPELADVMFIVGERRVPLYGCKAILACRSRVFRTMFKEGVSAQNSGARLTSPLVRRRAPHTVYNNTPQNTRKNSGRGFGKLKKKSSVPGGIGQLSPPPGPDCSIAFNAFCEDPKNIQISEHYIITGFTEQVFSEVLAYSMTGSCTIKPDNVVGLACAAERYELEELKQACLKQLPQCLVVPTVFSILSTLEKYLSYSSAKTMIITCLEFVDEHAEELLSSDDIVYLSENMVHLILRRDTEVPEMLKVTAAFAWGHANSKDGGGDFKSLVTPLVKHVRIHLVDPQDIMNTLLPSEVFPTDKIMAALAFQADPSSVQDKDFTMFRPRKKSSVLSSR